DAPGVVVTEPPPTGTPSAPCKTTKAGSQDPPPGAQAPATSPPGPLAAKPTPTATIAATGLPPPAPTLANSPLVTPIAQDPTLSNNSASISTPVAGGGVVRLVWDQPPPTAADPTPAPTNLRLLPGASLAAAAESIRIAPQDSCTLINVNVYK